MQVCLWELMYWSLNSIWKLKAKHCQWLNNLLTGACRKIRHILATLWSRVGVISLHQHPDISCSSVMVFGVCKVWIVTRMALFSSGYPLTHSNCGVNIRTEIDKSKLQWKLRNVLGQLGVSANSKAFTWHWAIARKWWHVSRERG